MKRVLCLAVMLTLGACTPVAQGTQDSARATATARDDIVQAFSELFTYHPKQRYTPPSSTRYCYRFASDVVCYDHPQPQLTAKLVGVQGGEGARIITQPAPEEAFAAVPIVANQPQAPIIAPVAATGAPLDTSRPVAASGSAMSVETKNIPSPFHSKESPHAKAK